MTFAQTDSSVLAGYTKTIGTQICHRLIVLSSKVVATPKIFSVANNKSGILRCLETLHSLVNI